MTCWPPFAGGAAVAKPGATHGSDELVLVERYLDVIAMSQAGIANVVAAYAGWPTIVTAPDNEVP